MSSSNSNRHLTLQERKIIETGIKNGSTKVAIASILGKDKSTIGKEIKLHRSLTSKSSLRRDCAIYKKCKNIMECSSSCDQYVPFKCKRRDRSPGACNGCETYNKCHFDRYRYIADLADKEYHKMLVDSREGINISKEELIRIGQIIEPLIKQGLSPYTILQTHEEINISEKTLYFYIESNAFKNVGIDLIALDLRRVVSRKITKKKSNNYKERKNRKYLKDRTYNDYKNFIDENPNVTVVQMDTVYNNETNGPFLQTFKFLRYGFMFIIYHENKTAKDMYDGILQLEELLGKDLFSEEVQVLVTDRGSEFTMADAIEKRDDGTLRTRIFYCDPMASYQKGSLEVMHELIRYICPKCTDLHALGLNSQQDANLIISHINSMPCAKYNGKSPLELIDFLNPKLNQKLKKYGIQKIEPDEIILKPYLLKK